ncbi:MAG: ribosome maturation factor RimP [Alphaproteobacteria bacterium]|nr:ribosome maturation factor RimP [Alphaproteobacteria bacterium]
MKLEEKIKEVIEAPLENKGYDLVRVNVVGGKKRLVVGIDIDRLDGKNVTVDDCVEANRLISAILDVEDFINGAYNLEVSSPGESRPLAKIRDFKRFCGQIAKMELANPMQGIKKFTGKIVDVDETENLIKVEIPEEDNREICLSIDDIKRANVKREF